MPIASLSGAALAGEPVPNGWVAPDKHQNIANFLFADDDRMIAVSPALSKLIGRYEMLITQAQRTQADRQLCLQKLAAMPRPILSGQDLTHALSVAQAKLTRLEEDYARQVERSAKNSVLVGYDDAPPSGALELRLQRFEVKGLLEMRHMDVAYLDMADQAKLLHDRAGQLTQAAEDLLQHGSDRDLVSADYATIDAFLGIVRP